MKTERTEQREFFENGMDALFAGWVHTPAGGEIANQFIRRSWWLWKRGIKRYGAKSIVEVLRWHYALRNKSGEEWKINNNYVSRLARLAMERAPELRGFFELRELKG
jgi:hypothetical protein